jgi:hypothetical protein
VEFDTTSNQVSLRDAIDQCRQAADDPQLLLDHLAQSVVALLTPTLHLELISDANDDGEVFVALAMVPVVPQFRSLLNDLMLVLVLPD